MNKFAYFIGGIYHGRKVLPSQTPLDIIRIPLDEYPNNFVPGQDIDCHDYRRYPFCDEADIYICIDKRVNLNTVLFDIFKDLDFAKTVRDAMKGNNFA